MIVQKVVRTYGTGYAHTTDSLDSLLYKGFVVVSSTPFLENGTTDCVEYIVQKEVKENEGSNI